MLKLHDLLFHDLGTFEHIFTVKTEQGKDRIGLDHTSHLLAYSFTR
jgi:hypothetical protein